MVDQSKSKTVAKETKQYIYIQTELETTDFVFHIKTQPGLETDRNTVLVRQMHWYHRHISS